MALTLKIDTPYTFTVAELWTALGNVEPYSGTFTLRVNSYASSYLPPGMTSTFTAVTGTPTTLGTFSIWMEEVDTHSTQQGSHELITSVVLDVDPEPEPEPITDETVARVAAFLNRAGDPDTIALAEVHVPIVTAFVKAYTRDRGFDIFGPNEDLAHVIVAASARLVVNPEQAKRVQVADYSETFGGLEGFTLPELAILNRYRRRTA